MEKSLNKLALMFCTFAVGPICLLQPESLTAETPGTLKEKIVMMHATGTFNVKTIPETQTVAANDLFPTARFALEKKFSGGMQGDAIGVMLTVGTPKQGEAAAYVAIDQFTGTVNGKRGSFALTHRATMSKQGKSVLEIQVMPDSGRGELEGIAGTLAIDASQGIHHYDFSYSLPPSP